MAMTLQYKSTQFLLWERRLSMRFTAFFWFLLTSFFSIWYLNSWFRLNSWKLDSSYWDSKISSDHYSVLLLSQTEVILAVFSNYCNFQVPYLTPFAHLLCFIHSINHAGNNRVAIFFSLFHSRVMSVTVLASRTI